MGGLGEVEREVEVGVIETGVALVLEERDVVVEVFFLSAAAVADEMKRRLKSQ